MDELGVSRRRLLAGGLAGGAAWALSPGAQAVAAAAAACAPAGSKLTDIEHVVILIQENRSFDHYFGTYRAVRGFGDHPPGRLGVFAQPWPANRTRPPVGHLLPFHFDTKTTDAECTNDITHEWGPQHSCWNGGRMDGFVTAHTAADGPDFDVATMGYYARADLPFLYALADAFTICDRYHCSVLGPTDPNRLYSMSATIDPHGRGGGPVVVNPDAGPGDLTGLWSWTTMPERLQKHGISWKVYNQAGTNNNVLALFKQYHDPSSPLAQNALAPTFPGQFQADVAAGELPQVSWVLAPTYFDEHPPAPSQIGEWVTAQVLSTLVSNPAVWARTVLFVAYDENGGFFDHVAPPTPPPGTPDEYLSVRPLPAGAGGVAGPIGLGFRVPALVVSPFSRGGLVCSDTFDHTSLLRFLETRFGVEVPNLSAWRRSVTGDLTSALNLAAHPNPSVPALPAPAPVDGQTLRECGPTFLQGQVSNVPPYPLPTTQTMPSQEQGRASRPSGVIAGGCRPAEPSTQARVSGATSDLARASTPASPSEGMLPATGGRSAGAVGALVLAGAGALLRLRRRAPGDVTNG